MAHCCGRPLGRLHVLSFALITATLLGYASGASAQMMRGVTDTEIVIGTIADLSGLGAPQGVNNTAAIRMVFDDANTKGGVHGRKIKYIVEDSQLSVSRSVQAMNKLINSDNVFFTLANAGTPINPSFPLADTVKPAEVLEKWQYGHLKCSHVISNLRLVLETRSTPLRPCISNPSPTGTRPRPFSCARAIARTARSVSAHSATSPIGPRPTSKACAACSRAAPSSPRSATPSPSPARLPHGHVAACPRHGAQDRPRPLSSAPMATAAATSCSP